MSAESVRLFTMVLQLLSVILMGAVMSAWLLRNHFTWPLIICSSVVSIILLSVTYGAASTGSFFVTMASGTLFGASIGVNLGGFTLAVTKGSKRGREAVALTLGVLAVSTLAAAIIGMLSGTNFQAWASLLFLGLLVLIGFGIIQIFVRPGRIVELIFGSVASFFWILYLVYDFNKVVDLYSKATPSAAAEITMNIFMDMVNLFVRLLPIIVEILDAFD